MKKRSIIAVLVTLIMCFALTACGGGDKMSTDYMNIDAVCVDDSYNKDDKCLVYMFYTVSTDDVNLELDSKSTTITVDGGNNYKSERVIGAADYAPNYYFSDYLEDVEVGTSLKVVETFKMPAAELEAGKTITIENDKIPDANKIKFATDVIGHYDNQQAVAEAADPEGYVAEVEARKDADAATVKKVKDEINGYYWSFFVNSTSYEIEFYEPNKFELRTSLGISNSGTYTVKNGYIFCKYPSNDNIVEIPYTFESGSFELDAADAFDVNE